MLRFRHRALVGFLVPILIARWQLREPAVKQSWVENYSTSTSTPSRG